MKLVTRKSTLAFLISMALAISLPGQAQRRRQTFEGVITLPNGTGVNPAPASFAGTVVSETTGEPLAGASVKLSRFFENTILAMLAEGDGSVSIPPIKTDDNGGFSFQGVTPAAYDLTVQLEGYLTRRIGSRTAGVPGDFISLNSGQQTTNFKVEMTRSARIDGRIRSEAGEGAAGIPLHLILDDSVVRQGGISPAPVAQTLSGPDGSYHLEGFSPGDYVVIAGSPRPLNGAALSFAARIKVPHTDGQRLDFSLDAKGGYNIRGRIGVDGMTVPPAEVSMTIKAMSPGGTVYFPRYDPVTGTFEVTGLFPGIYQISGSSRDPVLTGGCVSRNVLVTNADVTGLELIVKQCN